MAVTVTMPQLGETVTEGTILSWAKKVGDSIAEDEVLLEISTDKVDTEVPSPHAGIIQEILVAEGATVSVGTPLVVIATEQDTGGDAAGKEPGPPAEPVSVAEQVPDPAPVAPAAVPQSTGDAPRRGVLSPVVRRLAAEHGIDLGLVPGTGDGGRVTRKDVMAHLETRAPAPAAATPSPAAPAPAPAPAPIEEGATTVTFEPSPAAAGGDTIVEIGRLRRRIAANMANAKHTAAHVWSSVEVDYEAVERVRQTHRQAFKDREGFSLTYLPFIARATIDALAAFPLVNTSFQLDEGRQVFHSAVNLGIAVDLNQEGLVVVTVRGADGLRMRGLARAIRAMALKARDGALEPDDVSSSTFTITNPGPYGSFMSAPIINVPNVGILSTDTVAKRATVITLPDGTDTIGIHHIGYLGLTWDHRAFDGSTAVLFLGRIKQNLETWDWEQELL